ncbi:chloride channel protein [filamentous cyanobacterium CCP5]|nr:chloride channel protein [filamentous cyanobacterium CCP5]
MKFKPLRSVLGQKRLAVLEACIIGLVSGLAAVALKQGVESLALWRIEQASSAWWALPLVGLVGGGISGWMIQQFAPESSGSGVPHVKAVLGYVPRPLNLRVACVKLGSTLMALGAGLSLGRQGPTVQIGAALAAQLSRWVPTSPEYRRQLISAGAAAGLAAGFNAPISGVLFVVEELLQDFSGLTLGTAILASFVGAVVSRLLGGEGLNLTIGPLPIGLSLPDLPFLIILGLLSGLLGALFSDGILLSLNLFRRLKGWPLAGKVALAGLVTGIVGIFLPVAAQDNTGLREFLVTGRAEWQLIAIAFVSKFFLTLMAYGSGAAGGIFAPALVLGSALGCLVSFLAQVFYGSLGLYVGTTDLANTTTYALTGMGAFFSAVTRVPITAIVIVFEITASFNLVLPLMIGSGIAYLIADRLTSGPLYGRLLEAQGIQLGPTPQANPWVNLKAADLMQRRVETLSGQMPLSEAIQAFSRSHHRGFPVVEEGRLIGIVTQSDLNNSPISSLNPSQRLTDVMTEDPVTVSPEASLTEVLYLLNRLRLSRLPVTEGSRLVGIITRGDIIRAESDQVSGHLDDFGPQASPSYLVYQRCDPAIGQGRLLVPLSDPQTAPLLMQMACAIATERRYELECLHVIKVPRSLEPAEASLRLDNALALLNQAIAVGHRSGLSVHGQIRAAHEIGRTLLEVVKERNIDLLIMGWHRQTNTPGRIMGAVVDTVIRQASCPVMIVRPQSNRFDRWLIPTAGGPNSRAALDFLPGLLTLGKVEDLRLCYVHNPNGSSLMNPEPVEAMAQNLRLRHQQSVSVDVIASTSPATAIVELSQRHSSDVVLLGASREGMLSQVIHGNVPVEVALNSNATVILLRQAVIAGG